MSVVAERSDPHVIDDGKAQLTQGMPQIPLTVFYGVHSLFIQLLSQRVTCTYGFLTASELGAGNGLCLSNQACNDNQLTEVSDIVLHGIGQLRDNVRKAAGKPYFRQSLNPCD
ncbi:hypothetical protein [Citrobacter freundii]|uniref:hypothetical protein n=1 Tax=Citrobacter freundii TaxID=546 RepID=UPI001FFDEEFF|nr:hypothetical protein [Citrobacter freundii]